MLEIRKGPVGCTTFRLIPEKRNSGDTWVPKQFNNFPDSFHPLNIWTDGLNIYHSDEYSPDDHRVLVGDTWEVKTWKGVTKFDGNGVWTDGEKIYLSRSSASTTPGHYVLNGDTWEPKNWVNGESIDGYGIWTDGNKIYYSSNALHYVLNGDTWTKIEWNLSTFSADMLWSDGQNIYYSASRGDYVLNGEEWEVKTWGGQDASGSSLWTDGTNIFCSVTGLIDKQLVLNGEVWEEKTWKGVTEFIDSNIWSDGKNIYLTQSSNGVFSTHVLTPSSDPSPIGSTAMLLGFQVGQAIRSMRK